MNMLVRFAWGSRSAANTRSPRSAYIHAKWNTREVFPTPPLLLKKTTVFIWPSSRLQGSCWVRSGIQAVHFRFSGDLQVLTVYPLQIFAHIPSFASLPPKGGSY